MKAFNITDKEIDAAGGPKKSQSFNRMVPTFYALKWTHVNDFLKV